jgi:hypothetical protein
MPFWRISFIVRPMSITQPPSAHPGQKREKMMSKIEAGPDGMIQFQSLVECETARTIDDPGFVLLKLDLRTGDPQADTPVRATIVGMTAAQASDMALALQAQVDQLQAGHLDVRPK